MSVSSKIARTIRNAASKKWSTARTDNAMVSGLHRWDVHVDRCVSKNIFIGVSTAGARLDNYVGCDTHGWGFLANRAVWHGKSKLKSYGDLFCTGDVLTVSLDIDEGEIISCHVIIDHDYMIIFILISTSIFIFIYVVHIHNYYLDLQL